MFRLRRKDARKISKLAKALASLDAEARAVKPAPRRVSKLSFGA